MFSSGDGGEVEHLISEVSEYNLGKTGRGGWTCAWAQDTSYFAWSSGYRTLHLIPWDADKQKRHDPTDLTGLNGRQYHVIDCGEPIWSLAFGSGRPKKYSHIYRHCCSNQNLVVATGLASGRIKLFNCHTGFVIVELLSHTDTVRGLDISRDGSLQVISGSRDGTLKLWDLNDEGNMYHTYRARSKVNACKFSPNAKFAAAVGTKKMALLWRGPIPEMAAIKLEGHHNEVVSVDFSSDSYLLATASFDTKVIVWNAHTAQKLQILGHLFPSPSLIFAGGANDSFVRHVHFSKHCTHVATVCDDGFVRFWNWLEEEQGVDPVASVYKVSEPLCCQYSSGGSVLAVSNRSGDAVFFPAPSPVPSLQQMSRIAVHKGMRTNDVSQLPIPGPLRLYLQYLKKEAKMEIL